MVFLRLCVRVFVLFSIFGFLLWFYISKGARQGQARLKVPMTFAGATVDVKGATSLYSVLFIHTGGGFDTCADNKMELPWGNTSTIALLLR